MVIRTPVLYLIQCLNLNSCDHSHWVHKTKTLAHSRKHFSSTWHALKEELECEKGSERQTWFSHIQLEPAGAWKGSAASHLCALAGPSSRQVVSLPQLLVPKVSVARCWPSFSEGPSWAGTKRLLWGSVLQGKKYEGRSVRVFGVNSLTTQT